MKAFLSPATVALYTTALLAPAVFAADADTVLDEVTVTGTREAEPLATTAATVDSVSAEEIEETRPGHPSEIMNRIPGVHVNVTGGEGHMTAIRQPITTKPVYLYLEDGIPVRSTGFFNHNALYEINVPQSGGIEVLKGPGTALYGSDAIGAVINVLTRPAPLEPEADINLEAGEHGWRRALLSAGNTWDADGLRADVNLTRTDGWRDDTDYERYTGTLRWDRYLDSGAVLKSVLTYSDIDQQTAGSSRLSRDDYENDPTRNYTPISYRQVQALRFSLDYQQESGNDLVSITPYVRRNSMELLPNWSLSYDPAIWETSNDSIGMLLKYRHDLPALRARIIVGTDLDYSPGQRKEYSLNVTRVDSVYVDYSINEKIYDYDVAYSAVSPWVHGEMSIGKRMRLTAGLRYDNMKYDYDNRMSDLATGSHRRPGDAAVTFDHLSPKLGATWRFSPVLNGFLSYRHAFRAPSEGQLFRQGSSDNTVELDPIKVDSFETGVRGAWRRARYEISVYYMTKDDDIVTYRRDDGSRETQNAGKTLHRGVEIGLNTPLVNALSLAVSYSYAKHTFESWSPRAGVSYDNNEISGAPREMANVRLDYRPEVLGGGRVSLEWEHLGGYWEDDANTHKYGGHDVLNLRADYQATRALNLYARVTNLTDETYATLASYNSFRGEELAPGMERTVYAGLSYAMR